MADREQAFDGELVRSYEITKKAQRTLKGIGFGLLDQFGGFGSTSALTTALGTSPLAPLGALAGFSGTTPGLPGGGAAITSLVQGFNVIGISSFTFSLDAGTAYVMAPSTGIDATGAASIIGFSPAATQLGSLAVDPTTTLLQCILPATGVFTAVKPGAGSNFYLVYLTPTMTDVSDTDDPNYSGGFALLPYYNSGNPNTVLSGPGGMGATNPTCRKCSGTVAMTAAQTTAAALSLPANTIPLYLIQVRSTDGAALILTSNATTTNFGIPGRTTGGGFTPNTCGKAPFIAGMVQQHHLGLPGTAPQLDGAYEWLPSGPVPMNTQRITTGAASIAGTDFTIRSEFSGPNGLAINANAGVSPTIPTHGNLGSYNTFEYDRLPGGHYIVTGSITITIDGTGWGAGTYQLIDNIQLPYVFNSVTNFFQTGVYGSATGNSGQQVIVFGGQMRGTSTFVVWLNVIQSIVSGSVIIGFTITSGS